MHGNMGRMLRLFRPYKAQMTLALSLEVFAIITRLIVPRLTKMVVNDVITEGQYDLLYTLCGLIALFAVTRTLSNYVRAMRFQHVSQNIICGIRSPCFVFGTFLSVVGERHDLIFVDANGLHVVLVVVAQGSRYIREVVLQIVDSG